MLCKENFSCLFHYVIKLGRIGISHFTLDNFTLITMSQETGLDIVGIGKLSKAIPEKVWVQMVDTACKTFREVIAPLTAVTSGTGRLIEAKFDRLVDAEKVLAADAIAKAQEKISQSKKKPSGKAKASVVIAAIEATATETDVVARELWTNLLAQEIITGEVHPEFPRILGRLSAGDARLLAQIAEREQDKSVRLKIAIRRFAANISVFDISLDLLQPDEESSFTHEHLASLNLVRRKDGFWSLTLTGKAFIQSVSDSWNDAQAV